mgnify:CR=1 FL=1
MNKSSWLLVSLGAVPGALLRWHINNNFLVNILGSFIIGFIYASPLDLRFKLVIALGFCGALTTFSSWIFDTLDLLISGLIYEAFILLISMLFMGLVSVFLGYLIGKRLVR